MATQTKSRSGFTLVELLVVISIITILAAILVPTVFWAIGRAREGAISMEIGSIGQALEKYKLEYGEYPPDFSEMWNITPPAARAAAARAIIDAHLARTYRRRVPTDYPRANSGALNDAELAKLSPANALMFWLQGFSPDPQLPLSGAGTRQPFYNFDESRVKLSNVATMIDGFRVQALGTSGPTSDTVVAGSPGKPFTAEYFPSGDANQLAYIYYNHTSYTGGNDSGFQWAMSQSSAANPPPAPYLVNRAGVIDGAEPEGFQLICGGRDGNYGVGSGDPSNPRNVFPQGPYLKADQDNLTNFSDGKTLEDNRED